MGFGLKVNLELSVQRSAVCARGCTKIIVGSQVFRENLRSVLQYVNKLVSDILSSQGEGGTKIKFIVKGVYWGAKKSGG